MFFSKIIHLLSIRFLTLYTPKLASMNNTIINTATMQQWLNNNLSPKKVEETLISSGYETGVISNYLLEFDKLRKSRRQFIGFVLMGVGGFLGFIACVMAMLNVIPDMQDFFLFGLTMLGISLVLYGMYLAFN